jgi:hypothetical protein
VIKARYSLQSGPPLITMPRDVEETVSAWRERRDARRRERAEQLAAERAAEADRPRERRRHWWSRRSR